VNRWGRISSPASRPASVGQFRPALEPRGTAQLQCGCHSPTTCAELFCEESTLRTRSSSPGANSVFTGSEVHPTSPPVRSWGRFPGYTAGHSQTAAEVTGTGAGILRSVGGQMAQEVLGRACSTLEGKWTHHGTKSFLKGHQLMLQLKNFPTCCEH
jgi:hypothetical protein